MLSRTVKFSSFILLLAFWGLMATTAGSEGFEYVQYYQEDDVSTITANLIVADINVTLEFYKDFLDFELIMTAPDEAPFEFAMVKKGNAELMFQTRESLAAELPRYKDIPTGGSFTLFHVVSNIKELRERVEGEVKILKDINDTFYGMREFVIEDPDGYVIVLAQEIEQE